MNSERVEVLLVEDSRADAEMTLRTLKKKGIANNVEWVRDGVEAIDYLFCTGRFADRVNGHPKLVLLDLKMPRMDGLQVLERMKSDPHTRTIPVVMMTSSQEEADLVASYQLGANSFVVKPLEFEDFAEKVAQVGMYWMITNVPPGRGAHE
jgi:two-component system, response regulator